MTTQNYAPETIVENNLVGSARKWACLDADGIVVGHLYGESAQKAIEEFVSRKSGDSSFRRPVTTLVSGTIRLSVEGLNTA